MDVSNRLFAPESYRNALPEVVAKIVNGCGPGGWKVDLIPDTVLGLSIKEACNIHDWMYAEGETEGDKEFADAMFLKNCLRIVNNAEGFWNHLLKYHRTLRVYEYYEAVHVFGDSAFWAGKGMDSLNESLTRLCQATREQEEAPC